MNDGHQSVDAASVLDGPRRLIDEYRQRRDAWRVQAEELARLETEVCDTIDREATSIVAVARTDIQRILVAARRELRDLAGRVQTIVDVAEAGSAVSGTKDRCLEARHDLRRIMKDVAGELDRLQEDAGDVRRRAAQPADPRPPIDSPASAPAALDSLDEALRPFDEAQHRGTTRSGRFWTMRAAFAAIGFIPLLAFGLSLVRGRSEVSRPLPAVRVESFGPMALVPPLTPSLEAKRDSLSAARPQIPNGALMTAPVATSQPYTPASPGAAVPPSGAAGTQPVPPVTRPSGIAPNAAPGSLGPETQTAITTAAERWLDAYYRHDSAAMASDATPDLTITDQRAATDRPQPQAANFRRTLEHVRFQGAGASVILTARMTEWADAAGQTRPYVSLISQVWIRDTGGWKLLNVRMIADPSATSQ